VGTNDIDANLAFRPTSQPQFPQLWTVSYCKILLNIILRLTSENKAQLYILMIIKCHILLVLRLRMHQIL